MLPLIAQLVLLGRRKFLHGFVALAGELPLLWGERNPGAHLRLDARLLVGREGGVTLGNPEPLLLAPRVELVPILGERCQNLLIVRAELFPGRPLWGHLRQTESGQERENNNNRYSSECLSQLLKPWSR